MKQTDFLDRLDVRETSALGQISQEFEQKYRLTDGSFLDAQSLLWATDKVLSQMFPEIAARPYGGTDHYSIVRRLNGPHQPVSIFCRFREGKPANNRICIKSKAVGISRSEFEWDVSPSFGLEKARGLFRLISSLGTGVKEVTAEVSGKIRYIPLSGKREMEIVIGLAHNPNTGKTFLLAELEAHGFFVDQSDLAEAEIRRFEEMLGWEEKREPLSVCELLE